MPDEVDDFLERWHRFVSERDPTLLDPLLAKDISLGAPPYWGRLRGRETVQHLLGLIVQTIEGFTYHRQWRDGRELALEFTGRVGKLELQGIDLITLDESGAIQKLDVLMRPRDAIESLQETISPRMQAFLAERSGGGGA